MLPGLRGREVSVAPSAAAWCRIRDAGGPPDGDVVLVGGPGLAAGRQEVQRLAEQYREPVLLTDGAATAERVLACLDGARLAHVAAHGTLRSDSPLFSALELDDGPLTVYDLERLARAPHRVILSSCSSAVGTPTGADELLGLVSAFVALGSVGVLASVVPVEDPAAVPFMVELHRRLHAGDGLPAAHLHARTAVEDDPRVALAAGSFVALGV
jgi:CHAT domain-containing protein